MPGEGLYWSRYYRNEVWRRRILMKSKRQPGTEEDYPINNHAGVVLSGIRWGPPQIISLINQTTKTTTRSISSYSRQIKKNKSGKSI